LGFVLQSVHNFNESRSETAGIGQSTSSVGLGNGKLNILSTARAALGLLAGSPLALQLALGLSTVGGLHALVEAGELLAHRLALGLRSLAGSVAVSGLANRLTFRATFLLALILRAADGADRFLAVHSALGAGGFLALHLALGSLADRMTHSRASRVIALPLALRMAFLC